DMKKFFRSRAMLFTSLVQPALWLALFGLSMSSNFNLLTPTTPSQQSIIKANYLSFMASGIIAMTVLFTCLYSGISLQFDKQYGLMKEMVASPLPRSHILLGLSLSGIAKSLIQSSIIILFGYVLGVRFFEGYTLIQAFFSTLGIILFIVLFGLGLLFLASTIALKLESHESLQGVTTLLSLPLFFASNALYPTETLPAAIKLISYGNPLSYFITGMRYFSIGPEFYSIGTYYTYGIYDVLAAFTFLAAFASIMFLVALRTINKAKIV
ncbi:MAG: ABC transporter permease, partial [Candidatus Bathyarchaeia archaeon]